jgi:hypothetical protein
MTIRDFFIFAGMTTSSRQDEKQKNNIYIYIYIYIMRLSVFHGGESRAPSSSLLTYKEKKLFIFFSIESGFFFEYTLSRKF